MKNPKLSLASGATIVSLLTFSMLAATPAAAQEAAESPCVVAGRLDSTAHWAPRFTHLDLLDAEGKPLQPRVAAHQSAKDWLAQVKQVRVKAPALLSACNGNQPLARGDDKPAVPHATALAVAPGRDLIAVEAVNYPPMAVGGEWVELKLALNSDRVTMIASRRSQR